MVALCVSDSPSVASLTSRAQGPGRGGSGGHPSVRGRQLGRNFFFFLIIRPPPRSTLFPYTALFQSISELLPEPATPVTTTSTHNLRDVDVEDRKSTRLNSSHDQISYAVFCLKKK